MDKPIGMPDTPAGIPRDGMRRPVAGGRQGTVDERRVSERPPGAPMRPMRVTGEAGGIAGPVGARRSLDSRRATVDVSFSGGAVAAAGPGLPGGADRSSRPAEQPPGFLTTFTRLRSLESQYRDQPNREPAEKFLRAVRNLSRIVVRRYTTFIGSAWQLPWSEGGMRKAERAYAALREKARQAEMGGDLEQADSIREELTIVDRHAARELQTLSTTYGLTAPSSPRSPPLPSATNPPALDWGLVHLQLAGIQRHFFDTCQPQYAKYFEDCLKRMQAQIRRVFKTHGDQSMLLPMSGKHPPRAVQMYRLLEDMARRTEAEGDATPPGRIYEELNAINDKAARELRSLTRKFGPLETLAAQAGVPVQQAPPAGTTAVGALPPPEPMHPAPEPGSVPTASGAPAGGEAGQPPPGSDTPTVCALPTPIPSWLEDDFAVERALIAGELPAGFDASALVHEAGAFEQFGLGAALDAGWLPMQTIDALLEGYEATDRGGSNALFIDYLRSLKENIERALKHAYPGRTEKEWLGEVRALLQRRAWLAARTAPERAATWAVAVPPVLAAPFSEPPGPSSRIMPAPAVGTPLGPAREQLPAHRPAIVERLKSGEALEEARFILGHGGAEALGFSPQQTRALLEDLDRLHRFDGQDPAALADIDWAGIETLVAILDFVPPP